MPCDTPRTDKCHELGVYSTTGSVPGTGVLPSRNESPLRWPKPNTLQHRAILTRSEGLKLLFNTQSYQMDCPGRTVLESERSIKPNDPKSMNEHSFLILILRETCNPDCTPVILNRHRRSTCRPIWSIDLDKQPVLYRLAATVISNRYEPVPIPHESLNWHLISFVSMTSLHHI
jgi:hypothetical protein